MTADFDPNELAAQVYGELHDSPPGLSTDPAPDDGPGDPDPWDWALTHTLCATL